ncbi:MAG TPA: DUF5916 domain-containing protein [archaeon]|nr:DUF5916 domain-containing protein [archaeon]
MRKETVSVLLLSLVLALAVPASAQDNPSPRQIHAATAAKAPVIDGILDDPVWAAADWQSDFIQLKPTPGELSGVVTHVAVACDSRHIYAAFRCLNPAGSRASSSNTSRDSDMDQDNAVTLYLDTFNTRRDCYYFSTNSLGTQVDGRIGEDGISNDKKWDCAWQVVSHEDSLGWSCEMAIPVSELRTPRGEGLTWGINFRRNCPELFETSFWQEREAAWRISQSGELLGLPAFDRLFSATLFPYLVGLDSNQPSSGRRTIASADGRELIGGADLRLKLGNTVDGNLTWNPDFATVEADLTQLNLTRYETQYPEKRLYFIEGAELFNNLINVFYSRRIGDIDWGVKTNGRLGQFNYAMLATDERTRGEATPAAHTEVLRLQRDILGSSNIGITAVSRAWDGGYARVLSGDGVLNLTPTTSLRGQYVGTFPSGDEDAAGALALRLAYSKWLYEANVAGSIIDPGFRQNVNPVGYIQDDDRRELSTGFLGEHWINRLGIDKISFNQDNGVTWRHSGALKRVRLGGRISVTFLSVWRVGYIKIYETELFEKRFHNSTQLWEWEWDSRTGNNIYFSHNWGRNFDRDFNSILQRGGFKLSDELRLDLAVTRLHFSPNPTSQGTYLCDLTINYNFTPDLWFRLTSQYNSRNDRMYVYGLFGWRFAPPFGALYVAYTADRFDILDGMGRLDPLAGRENQRAFFAKLTLPVALLE